MDPAVRVAIVGFHKDIEVEYNLYEMSSIGNYRSMLLKLREEKQKVAIK